MAKREKIYDGHHHLWDLDACHYPWLMAKGVKRFFGDPSPIQTNYFEVDFLNDAKEYDVIGSTHIQVGVIESDAVRETAWLQTQAETNTGLLPSAIVGFADLTDDRFNVSLDEHQKYSRFKGVRQIIGRHPSEDKQNKSGELLQHPRFASSLNILSERRLRFDLQLTQGQYSASIEVFSKIPDLAVAICHFGSPWDLSLDGFKTWRSAMREFAEMPKCHIKFSGFGMFKSDWSLKDIEPYVETALDLFGPERCFAGSNFPVDKLYGGYWRIWDALKMLIEDYNIYEKVTRTNAARFYGVTLAS